jgi:hypothetical protein
MPLGLLRFTNVLAGTADFIYPGGINMQSPASAGAQDATPYLGYAMAFDGSQWEISTLTYNAGLGKFVRTAVIANSLGNTAKINFVDPPHVVVLDSTTSLFSSLGISAAITAAIAAAAAAVTPPKIRPFLSGTSYVPTSGCAWFDVEVQAPGGGGGGGGSSGSFGTAGGTTTFVGNAVGSTTAISCTGGAPGGGAGNGYTGGGGASGGDLNIQGGNGAAAFGAGATSSVFQGATGGGSQMGRGGPGSWPASPASAGTGYGGGGGGGGSGSAVAGQGAAAGAGGGYAKKRITAPEASYTMTIGAKGTGGAAGGPNTPGAGGDGAPAIIVVHEHFRF